MPGPAFTLALGLSALLAAGSAGCPPGIGEPIPSGAVPAMPAAGISYRDRPMIPRVVRDARPGCGDACAEWIAMEGRIMPGTGEAFAGMLRTLGARRLPVFVDSGGGAVDDAMTVGKLIRERHLDVAVAQTIPAQTSPDCAGCGPESALPRSPGAVCASACVLVLAAGTGRVVGLATHVGVHQMSMKGVRTVKRRMFRVFYRTVGGVRQEIGRRLLSERTLSSTAFSEPASRATDERVARYLDRMGIGAGLMPLMLSTPATGIRWLTPGEGREISLFTASDGGETLLLRQRVALAPLANDAGGSSGPTLIGAATFEAAGAEPGQPASGKVAWTLEKPTLGLPILVATITIPTAGLALMLRIAPESTARAAPLVLDAVVKGGRDGPARAAPLAAARRVRRSHRCAADDRADGLASPLERRRRHAARGTARHARPARDAR